jgi:putative ABC transport system ATP-binding protein
MLDVIDAEVIRAPKAGERGFRLSAPRIRLAAGERIGIVGPSGAGKTTVLELLSLLRRPDRLDRFEICGEDVTPLLRRGDKDALARTRRRALAYAPQNGGLLPYLTVRENARLAGRLAGRPTSELELAIAETASRLGIGALLAKKPGRLSGGERQRAALLRMAVMARPLVMADEPTAALDRRTAEAVLSQLAETAADAGSGLICVSHDTALLERFGFRLATVRVSETADGAGCDAVLEDI